MSWFCRCEMPKRIGSDREPQFDTDFGIRANNLGMRYKLVRDYNPCLNGLNESGVKQIKKLIQKTEACKELEFDILVAFLYQEMILEVWEDVNDITVKDPVIQ